MVSEGIVLGSISIAVAVGLSAYWMIKENVDGEGRDSIADRMAENLGKMAQYFLDVETTTVRNEEREVSASRMMRSLGSFYRRNEREMKDLLYQTRLYLPLWSGLPPEDRREIDGVLEMFSWLLYGYYRQALPEQLRQIGVVESREAFLEKKARVMTATDGLLRRYEAPRAK